MMYEIESIQADIRTMLQILKDQTELLKYFRDVFIANKLHEPHCSYLKDNKSVCDCAIKVRGYE
jgi:hypothetical protein